MQKLLQKISTRKNQELDTQLRSLRTINHLWRYPRRIFYRNSNITKKFYNRVLTNHRPAALIADIDGTLWVPGEEKALFQLNHVLERNNYGKIYITGGSFNGVMKLKELPLPDILVTSVGTEIYVRHGNNYVLDPIYEKRLKHSRWDRANVQEIILKLLPRINKKRQRCEFQPDDEPTAPAQPAHHKVSLFFTGRAIEREWARRLLIKALPQSNIIFSKKVAATSGLIVYNIDILPKKAGKAEALRYLRKQLNLSHAFVAGDSGNDIDMFLVGKFPAILVGGATEEAEAAILALTELKKMVNGIQTYRFHGGKQQIYIGDRHLERGPRSILNVLKDSDLNEEDAYNILSNVYYLEKRKKQYNRKHGLKQ